MCVCFQDASRVMSALVVLYSTTLLTIMKQTGF